MQNKQLVKELTSFHRFAKKETYLDLKYSLIFFFKDFFSTLQENATPIT